ncbi:hypothetical protein [Rubrivivax benzoatilyticus]|uniref:RiboL-PSP-HEPN domain-containing protein n=1 Tax=Rubrivivax benzoatilyticus TaxID=316997 RepID=A0ABX0HSL0_9BURK|nr:hypothetical protein [Rubrivivax benzoatilyticus]NHK97306.1 hypothetical protein [Rubrivivax benzoatilyticus]NHL22999.1 hypothetical protein [Rubrivivax benzoatilyticus]
MGERVAFSGEQLGIAQIAEHYNVIEKALRSHYLTSPASNPNFFGYTYHELREELTARLEEEGRMMAMSVLAAIEAAFRVDYLQRVYERKKDPLSREFRRIYKKKGPRAGLEEEILEGWKNETQIPPRLISDLRSAFRFRHWLAHGRYWNPKLGRKFDYFGVQTLAQQAAGVVPALAQ